MKKCLLLILAFMVTIPAYSYITSEEDTNQKYIKGHGHSNEMARLINLQQAQINSTQSKYNNPEPDIYDLKVLKPFKRLMMYFDCGLDDGNFMQNNIDYTTRFDDL